MRNLQSLLARPRARFDILGLGMLAALTGCAATHHKSQVAMLDCATIPAEDTAASLMGAGKVKHVEPTYRQEFLARAIQPKRLVGANLYVPAQPGVTAAYAERVLACHAVSSGPAQSDDPLRVDGGATVRVAARGPSLRISVTGKTREASQAIWERAQALHGDAGDVQVDQLSSTPHKPAM